MSRPPTPQSEGNVRDEHQGGGEHPASVQELQGGGQDTASVQELQGGGQDPASVQELRGHSPADEHGAEYQVTADTTSEILPVYEPIPVRAGPTTLGEKGWIQDQDTMAVEGSDAEPTFFRSETDLGRPSSASGGNQAAGNLATAPQPLDYGSIMFSDSIESFPGIRPPSPSALVKVDALSSSARKHPLIAADHDVDLFAHRDGLFGRKSPRDVLFVRSPKGSSQPTYLSMTGRLAPDKSHALKHGGTTSERRPGKKVAFETEIPRLRTNVDQSGAKQLGDGATSTQTADTQQDPFSKVRGTPRHDVDSRHDADIWPMYLEHALVQDKEAVRAWNSDLDSILIFAALFSAVLTTLVVQSYQTLQPDPQVEMMRAVLTQLQKNANASEPVQSPIPPFMITSSAIRVNVYWFSSLIISLSTALLAILAKQWVNYLLAGLSPVPSTQGRHRQYRMDGLHKWNLPAVLSFLPLLLHIALLLFFTGLVDFVWALNRTIGVVAAVLVITTFLAYASTNLLSYIYPECPFKTSVTVYIAIGHDLYTILHTNATVRVRVAWAALSTITHFVGRLLRSPRTFGRRTLTTVVSEIHETKSYVESEKPKYSTLRISSLRHQDEQYIARHASLMDARVYIWLVHNVARFASPDNLAHSLIRFPGLIRHRQLFIQKGVTAFLERILKRWFSRPWDNLTSADQQRVTSLVRALGMLACEVEVDGPEFTDTTVPAGTRLDNTPFLPVHRRQWHRNTNGFLTHDSLQLIGHLLPKLNTLSLPLAAFTLRLALQLAEGDHAVSWAELGGNKLIEDFLERVINFGEQDRPLSELIPAVNTVIYLALWDAARLQRNRPALASTGLLDSTIRSWLTVLLEVMRRAPMDGIMLRQICWAICTLSWTLSPQANSVTMRPFVPRLRKTDDLSLAFVDMVSCDQDPQVLAIAVRALEGMLWNVKPTQWDEHREFCKALQLRYGTFLADLYMGTRAKELPLDILAKNLIPLSRVAAYLAFFDMDGPEDAKAHFIDLVFKIFRHLDSTGTGAATGGRDAAEPLVAAGSGGTQPAGAAASGSREKLDIAVAARRWIHRAACRMVVLYFDDPRWDPDFKGGWQSDELVFANDKKSTLTLGHDIAAAVRAMSSIGPSNNPRRRPLERPAMEGFCGIVREVFMRGLRPNVDVREVDGWDTDVLSMLTETLKSTKPLMDLLSSSHTCVQVDILAPMVHRIYTTLFAGSRPITVITRSSATATTAVVQARRYNHLHPANQLVHALRSGDYLSFLEALAQDIKDGLHSGPDMHEMLIDIICISGYLTFFGSNVSTVPREPHVATMVEYLRAVTRNTSGNIPLRVHRSAWCALGSMAKLYMYHIMQYAEDDNPVRHFRCDKAVPEDIAVGFIRILSIRAAKMRKRLVQPHCPECAHDVQDARKWKTCYYIPDSCTEAVLEMMLQIWDGTDWESEAIQRRLLHHGLILHLPQLTTAEGSTGTLAKFLATRVEATAANVPFSSLQRRRTR